MTGNTAGYVRTHIIVPSTIYGIASNPLVDAGLANAHSIQIPSLIKAGIDRGQAGTVGKGANRWPNVHVDDSTHILIYVYDAGNADRMLRRCVVADLFIVLLDAALERPDEVGHGREGFYFGENGEHTLLDISKEIGKALVALGKAKTDEVTSFTQADLDKYYGGVSSVSRFFLGLVWL